MTGAAASAVPMNPRREKSSGIAVRISEVGAGVMLGLMDDIEKKIRFIKKVMAQGARRQAAAAVRQTKMDRELLLTLKTADRLLSRCDPDDLKGRFELKK